MCCAHGLRKWPRPSVFLRWLNSSLVLDSLRAPLRVPFVLHPDPLPLDADPTRFGAVVLHQLTEPRVFDCLSGGDALLGVVDEDFPEQVQEKFVELCGGRDDFFQALHGSDEFARLSRSVGERVSEVLVLEEASGAVAIAALALFHDFADQGFVNGIASDSLMTTRSACASSASSKKSARPTSASTRSTLTLQDRGKRADG